MRRWGYISVKKYFAGARGDCEEARVLCFSDNGTGMTVFETENYLLRVGTSKYSSQSFQKEYPEFVSISRFGIGILTCFLVANDIEIITNSTAAKNGITFAYNNGLAEGNINKSNKTNYVWKK